ncbi:glutamate synthase subunit beta [Roseivirga sp. BDSF3-8]|uniref:glutamate synthase subunit beta n=1 Tax=Roseivirga sp. BDSF3-8 TaxID=3241598 RepID=UPI0035325953
MSKDGFLTYDRELPQARQPKQRTADFKEIYQPFPEEKTRQQAARCMDCGVPFCHSGCPLGNIIPEFNEAVHEERWGEAAAILLSTNNFPEFTGRICPAPCEASCVLGINKPPVAIEHIEKTIAEKAFAMGLAGSGAPRTRTGKKVAVIGSGPAGLAAAAQLNKAGHWVTVFERDDRPGGLLRYGIPDFKLEKWVVDRRISLMQQEGIRFRTGTHVGINLQPAELLENFDAIVLGTGATKPRDLPIPGRELSGVHFAMDFLTPQNKLIAGDNQAGISYISAKDKDVIVIGGGDTGADCIGTSHRQGASYVAQLEIMPKPAAHRGDQDPWPLWPMTLRTSSSHEEGGSRAWSITTRSFIGNEHGKLTGAVVADLEWYTEDGKRKFREVPGSERTIPCDLALLAIGFTCGEPTLPQQLDLELDERGNIKTQRYQTNIPKVFAAGDVHRGQSLVVWAISEGREAAWEVDTFLTGSSSLERKDDSYMIMR